MKDIEEEKTTCLYLIRDIPRVENINNFNANRNINGHRDTPPIYCSSRHQYSSNLAVAPFLFSFCTHSQLSQL